MDQLRLRSRWLARAILVVLVILLLVPVTVTVAIIFGRYRFGDVLIWQSPMLFYAVALWAIYRALAKHAAGGSLRSPVGRSIQIVGIALFFGGLWNVFLVPAILRAMHGRGSYAFFEPAAITLGAVGLSLVVIGRLLRDAEAAQRELDEFL